MFPLELLLGGTALYGRSRVTSIPEVSEKNTKNWLQEKRTARRKRKAHPAIVFAKAPGKWMGMLGISSYTPPSEKTSNSASLSKVTSIAGLRMFVAFLVFATAPCKWLALYARSSDIQNPNPHYSCILAVYIQEPAAGFSTLPCWNMLN